MNIRKTLDLLLFGLCRDCKWETGDIVSKIVIVIQTQGRTNTMPHTLMNGRREWESKINWSQRMSRKVLLQTKVKNQHELNRLGFKMKQLEKSQELADLKQERELQIARDQYRRMVASSYVYKEHRFEKYDPYLRPKSESRKDVTRIPGYAYIRMWRQSKKEEDKENEDTKNPQQTLWNKIPPATKTTEQSNHSHIAHGHTESNITKQSTTNTSISQKWKMLKSPAQADEHTIHRPKTPSPLTKLTSARDVFQTFMTNSTITDFEPVKIKRVKRKEKTFTYCRDRTIFAGACKSTYEMRKFMENEVTKTIFSLSPEGQHLANLDRLKEKVKIPNFVDRSRSMSAILTRYKTYKDRNMLTSA